MTCEEVRDRLTEHALGLLSPSESVAVERHLEHCAGCRKEAGELLDGAATVARSVPQEEPPPSLERSVVDRVLIASGQPSIRHPQHGPTIRRFVVVTLAAVLIAMLSIGWGFAERLHAGDVQRSAAARVQSLDSRISSLLARFPGGSPLEAQLSATPGSSGFGYGVIVSAPKRDDLLLVQVFEVPRQPGPYSIRLQTSTGVLSTAGVLRRTTSGDLVFTELTAQDLSKIQFIWVLDRSARPVMTGRVRPYSNLAAS